MRVLVCGGRDFFNKELVFEVLDEIHLTTPITLIIHGKAKGADSLAHAWAESRGVKSWGFPANWDKWGKRAGAIRNHTMLVKGLPNLVVAFPGGSGTTMMVEMSEKAGVKVRKVK